MEWNFYSDLSSVWKLDSFFGFVGIILNGYLLYIFYKERHSLLTSVNAMIGSVIVKLEIVK